MIKARCLFLPSMLLILNGCASTGKSVGAGAVVGGALGSGVGAIADPGPDGQNRVRNVLIGTAVGAGIGAGAGYFLHKRNENELEEAKAESRKEAEDRMAARMTDNGGDGAPKLLPPKTEARWVPDTVKGTVFVPGHFEYQIIEPARWEAGR